MATAVIRERGHTVTWASPFTALRLSFLICKMGMLFPTSQGCCEDGLYTLYAQSHGLAGGGAKEER